MRDTRIGAVIFHAQATGSEAVRWVDDARIGSAIDLVRTLRPHVDAVVVVGRQPGIGALSEVADDTHEPDTGQAFHFGKTLVHVLRTHELTGAVYFGSGSGGLLEPQDAARYVQFARGKKPAALLNNFYSCDFGAFADVASLLRLELPEVDNGLGFRLADSGIDCYQLPRTVVSQFDIDTPTDLLLAKHSGKGGPHLRAALAAMDLRHPSLMRVLELLADRTSMLHLLGRVNPATWQHFEQEVACRTSGMVDGRGMKATARTRTRFLAQLLQSVGIDRFFSDLEACTDGALIDTRPLLAAGNGDLPSADVRFNSDLLRTDEIEDPTWRAFTQRAKESSIPIILGGHSLVSGGLFLLASMCWKGRTLPRRLHPEPFV